MESSVSLRAGGATEPAPTARPAKICWAAVSDGTVVTRYRVAGAGAPVVLLGETAVGGSTSALFEELTSHFRVFAPELDGADAPRFTGGRSFSAWLRGFLDGLGLSDMALVAGPEFALAGLGYVLLDYTRVTRLVLLVRDAADPAAPAGGIRDMLVGVERPLLVMRLDDAGMPAAADVAAEVVQFLSSEAPVV